jgi:hypothetical protein
MGRGNDLTRHRSGGQRNIKAFLPLKVGNGDGLTSQDYSDILEYTKKHGGDLENYDVVKAVYSDGDPEKDNWIKGYVDVGVNWVLECLDPWGGDIDVLFEMVKRGSPQF